ncbi:hypothetical protein BH11ACT3_BH11ACT3_12800 [soil metagenome]
MTSQSDAFEYPDTAGYPDGTGFLDEGTTPREVSGNLVEEEKPQ